MICLVCNLTKITLAYPSIRDLEYVTYKAVDFYRCEDCGLLFQDPLPKPEDIGSFYPNNYRNYLPIDAGVFAILKKLQFKNQAKKFTKHFTKQSKILEIGSGSGELLLALKSLGYNNLSACDLSNSNAAKLHSNTIGFIQANIEEGFPYSDKFDVIIMNNVIEHFINPRQVIENASQLLNPGGKLLLITPNSDALDLSIFGKYWAGFHAPRHIFIFNPDNLMKLAQSLGFKDCHSHQEADPGQWAISLQNFLQTNLLTRTRLNNGLAFYTIFFSILSIPLTILQNLINRSASIFVVCQK